MFRNIFINIALQNAFFYLKFNKSNQITNLFEWIWFDLNLNLIWIKSNLNQIKSNSNQISNQIWMVWFKSEFKLFRFDLIKSNFKSNLIWSNLICAEHYLDAGEMSLCFVVCGYQEKLLTSAQLCMLFLL